MKPGLALLVLLGAVSGAAASSEPSTDELLQKVQGHPKQATIYSAMEAILCTHRENWVPFIPGDGRHHIESPYYDFEPITDYPYPQRLTFTVGVQNDPSYDHQVTVIRKSP